MRLVAFVMYLLATNAIAQTTDSAQSEYSVGSSVRNEVPPEILDMVRTMTNRVSNGRIASWCTGDGYSEQRCKQHLRGRMMRFSCPLNTSYEDLRRRWIASYDDVSRHDLHPDDAFYAFLEDEDFCEPKQPRDSMGGAVFMTTDDGWD